MEAETVRKKRSFLMTIVWIGLGGVTLLVVAVVVIGLLMPERYEGHSEVVYARAAEEVWGALIDYDKHPMTGRMMRSVQALPPENNLPVWIEAMGNGELITVKTVRSDRPRHMVREMISKSLPMTSRWEYTLEPAGDGCKLTIDGETYIRRGTWLVPIFRVMMVLGGGVARGLDIQMDMLADTLGVEAVRNSIH